MPSRRLITVIGLLGVFLLGCAPTYALAVSSWTQIQSEEIKTELEIKKLRQETGLEGRVSAYIPLLSVLIAAAAAVFGGFKYLEEQRKERELRRDERELRIDAGVTTALNRLLEFPAEGKSYSVSALAALTELDRLTTRTADPQYHRKHVTDLIITAVSDDVDMLDLYQARFDPLCMEHWPDYKIALEHSPQQHKFIVYRYSQALRELASRDKEYFRLITVGPSGEYLVSKYIEEKSYLLFQRLVAGYTGHVDLMTEKAERAKAVEDFAKALDNPKLAAQLFEA